MTDLDTATEDASPVLDGPTDSQGGRFFISRGEEAFEVRTDGSVPEFSDQIAVIVLTVRLSGQSDFFIFCGDGVPDGPLPWHYSVGAAGELWVTHGVGEASTTAVRIYAPGVWETVTPYRPLRSTVS